MSDLSDRVVVGAASFGAGVRVFLVTDDVECLLATGVSRGAGLAVVSRGVRCCFVGSSPFGSVAPL